MTTKVNVGGFTQRQLDWLEERFKENLDFKATPEDLYRSQGARHVVAMIRNEIDLDIKYSQVK